MATQPGFAATPHVGAITVPATLDTSLTAPTNVAIAFTGGASGSRVDSIRINQVATTSGGGVLNIFLYDGANYHLLDVFTYSAVTLSTTSESGPVDIYYQALMVPSGWSIRTTVTTAGGQSAYKVICFGGDF